MLALTYPVKTWAHRVPVGWKLLFLAVGSILLFPIERTVVLGIAFIGVLILHRLVGRGVLSYGMRLFRPLIFMGTVILIYHIATGQFLTGVNVVLRILAMVGLANLVTMTSRLDDMIALVEWMLHPLRVLGVNTRAIGIAIAMVVRFTPVLAAKGAALIESWNARSARRTNWRVVMPLCLLALDDADHVAEALKARGGISPQGRK